FEHVSAELLADLDAEDAASLEDVIHGSADLHWLSCHGWLHFLQHGSLPSFLSGDINISKYVDTSIFKCVESENLERCPMLRRLILQYVSCTLEENVVEQEYHKAVEKCPWVKILYYEAANQVPKLMAEIQDLLTEKELRIHVTPEELEILRESAPPEDSVAKTSPKREIDAETIDRDVGGDQSANSEIDVNVAEPIDRDVSCDLESIPLPPSISSSDDSETDSSDDSSDSAESDDDVRNSVQQSAPDNRLIENLPQPDLSSWDDDRLSKARDTFVAKRAAKRSVDDSEQIDDSRTEYDTKSTKMAKLEETEVAKLVGDSCQDENPISDYVSAEWNKEKLKAIREQWESKRKKL
ncbi:unnamed protein product, partial [Nesidiocoris tenuis]